MANRLAAAVHALNVLDCASTLWLFALVGPGYEANPLMAWCLRAGAVFFVAVKLVSVAVFSQFLALQHQRVLLGLAATVLLAAVVMNAVILWGVR